MLESNLLASAVLLLLLAWTPARAGIAVGTEDIARLSGLWAAQTGLGALPALDPPSLGPAAPARALPKTMSLRGFSSSWIQDCSAGCGLPAGVKKNDPVELTLAFPDVPGEFRMAKFSRSYGFKTADGEAQLPPLEVAVSIYAVCPRGAPSTGPSAAGTPREENGERGALPSENDSCPARYFQAQIELSGAAAAQCGVSLNQADVDPFPVMACGALLRGKPFRVGISLHRVPL